MKNEVYRKLETVIEKETKQFTKLEEIISRHDYLPTGSGTDEISVEKYESQTARSIQKQPPENQSGDSGFYASAKGVFEAVVLTAFFIGTGWLGYCLSKENLLKQKANPTAPPQGIGIYLHGGESYDNGVITRNPDYISSSLPRTIYLTEPHSITNQSATNLRINRLHIKRLQVNPASSSAHGILEEKTADLTPTIKESSALTEIAPVSQAGISLTSATNEHSPIAHPKKAKKAKKHKKSKRRYSAVPIFELLADEPIQPGSNDESSQVASPRNDDSMIDSLSSTSSKAVIEPNR